MVKILVTGAGGASGVSLIEALARDDIRVHAADMSEDAAGLALVPAERRHLVAASGSPAFIAELLALCARLAIRVLIPTADDELLPLARASAAFERAGVRVLVAAAPALERCLDKLELAHVVNRVARAPRTEIFDDALDPDAWRYPVIVKPRSGRGRVEKITSAAALYRLPRAPHLIVQDYAPGIAWSVDVLANQRGDVIACVPRTRLKADSRVAVAAATIADPLLVELATAIATAVGLTGVASLQFKRDRLGQPSLLDIHPRFPDTIALTIASGVPMPRYAVHDLLGLPLPVIEPFRAMATLTMLEG